MTKYIFFFIFLSIQVFGQKKILKIFDSNNNKLIAKTFYSDSLSAISFTNNFITSKNITGYITANYDSVYADSVANLYYFLNLGKKYFWKKISFKVPDNILRKSSVKQRTFTNKKINQKKLQHEINKILTYTENNGYPFAILKLDSVTFNNNFISANLVLKKNNYISINDIKINGNIKTSKKFLLKYLDIKKGNIYSEKNIKKIDSRLRNLNFISQKKPLQIYFFKDSANINLYLNKKNANKFNGMLGFLPDNKLGKINLTGELNLHLVNTFKHAEEIIFNWQKIEALSQELNTEILLPYFLNTNAGIKAKFNLLKKDTTYINTNPHISVLYYFSGNNYVNIFYEQKKSSLISTYGFDNLTVLPDYADFTTNIYGFGITTNNLDYLYNPRKGVFVNISLGSGIKNIRKNSKINSNLYDNITLKTKTYQGKSNIYLYYPIYRNFVIKYRNSSGLIKSDNLFLNELFQIGGITTIRGFDEKSIFVSKYTISSIELRYLFELNSAVYGFFDYCNYEQKLSKTINDNPYGFGLGVDFETKVGIFTINYALGSQKNNAIALNSAKIHFGYVNRF